MTGPEGEERLQGSRGERRLNALNPHGNIDFMLPSAGMSEYLGTSSDGADFRRAHIIDKRIRLHVI